MGVVLKMTGVGWSEGGIEAGGSNLLEDQEGRGCVDRFVQKQAVGVQKAL